MIYEYYIAYNFNNPTRQTQGVGWSCITKNYKIEGADDIKNISDFIAKENDLEIVVILNFILTKEHES